VREDCFNLPRCGRDERGGRDGWGGGTGRTRDPSTGAKILNRLFVLYFLICILCSQPVPVLAGSDRSPYMTGGGRGRDGGGSEAIFGRGPDWASGRFVRVCSSRHRLSRRHHVTWP